MHDTFRDGTSRFRYSQSHVKSRSFASGSMLFVTSSSCITTHTLSCFRSHFRCLSMYTQRHASTHAHGIHAYIARVLFPTSGLLTVPNTHMYNTVGDDCEAVYQQDAGVLDADECLTQLWDQIAQSEGVDAVTNSKVQKIIPNYKSKNVDTNQNNDASDSDKHSKPGTGAARGACASSKKKTAAVVLSDGCTYTADSVVLTPGAWINDLMTKIDYDSNNHTHTQTHNADAASEAERDRVIDNASPLQFPLYISDESVSYHLPLNHAQSSASSSNSNDNNNDIDGSTSGGGDASNQGYVGHTANDMPIWIGHFDFGIIPGMCMFRPYTHAQLNQRSVLHARVWQ